MFGSVGKTGAATVMLTPAEELGLSGMILAGRVRKAFDSIPERGLLDLLQAVLKRKRFAAI